TPAAEHIDYSVLGAVAQLGARVNRTHEVRGSNPLGSTKGITSGTALRASAVSHSGRNLASGSRLVAGGPEMGVGNRSATCLVRACWWPARGVVRGCAPASVGAPC